MTTLILDLKRKTLYADEQCTNSVWRRATEDQKTTYLKPWNKVYKIGDNILLGCSGDLNFAKECKECLVMGDPLPAPTQEKQVCLLLLMGKRNCAKYFTYQVETVERKFRKDTYKWKVTEGCANTGYVTCGSGGDYAYGALMGGCTPEEAIIAASKADTYTNSDVSSVSL